MTEEEKKILIKELCTRLPHGVKVLTAVGYRTLDTGILNSIISDNVSFLPLLRPLSTMTDKEKEELKHEHEKDEMLFTTCISKSKEGDDSMRGKVITHFAADWCYRNHFDFPQVYDEKEKKFKTMAEMGLTLPAPEGMYNIKQ